MEETVELYYAWKKATDAIAEAKQMIYEEKDEEMKSFLKMEMEENEAKFVGQAQPDNKITVKQCLTYNLIIKLTVLSSQIQKLLCYNGFKVGFYVSKQITRN